ncbi:hypothetical protein [Streptomyces sp. NPDC051567]|uniref:hypothetical protein n=1 Tax=Streptomyces sp. NPDC051567 TaxID=3365660 RepID=UPI0037A34FE2
MALLGAVIPDPPDDRTDAAGSARPARSPASRYPAFPGPPDDLAAEILRRGGDRDI